MNDLKIKSIKSYILNCFLLTIPVLVWDIIFTNRLPKEFQSDIFWKDIPTIITYGENIFRTFLFLLLMLIPLTFSTKRQKRGLVIYLVGILFYFISWLVLIYYPNSIWSNSSLGFIAPAFTPLIWLIGIEFIGNTFYFKLPYNRIFLISAIIIFILFHCLHTIIVFYRTR